MFCNGLLSVLLLVPIAGQETDARTANENQEPGRATARPDERRPSGPADAAARPAREADRKADRPARREGESQHPVDIEVRLITVKGGVIADDADDTSRLQAIRHLIEEGKPETHMKFRMKTFANQRASMQFGETASVVRGQVLDPREALRPRGAVPRQSRQTTQVGTLLAVTPQALADGRIAVEVTFEHSRLVTPQNANPGGLVTPLVATMQFNTSTTIEDGGETLIGEHRSGGGESVKQTFVTLTAQVQKPR